MTKKMCWLFLSVFVKVTFQVTAGPLDPVDVIEWAQNLKKCTRDISYLRTHPTIDCREFGFEKIEDFDLKKFPGEWLVESAVISASASENVLSLDHSLSLRMKKIAALDKISLTNQTHLKSGRRVDSSLWLYDQVYLDFQYAFMYVWPIPREESAVRHGSTVQVFSTFPFEQNSRNIFYIAIDFHCFVPQKNNDVLICKGDSTDLRRKDPVPDAFFPNKIPILVLRKNTEKLVRSASLKN